MTLSLKYILIALFFKSKGAVLRRNWEVGGRKPIASRQHVFHWPRKRDDHTVGWLLLCRNGLHVVFCEHRFMVWPTYRGFKLAKPTAGLAAGLLLAFSGLAPTLLLSAVLWFLNFWGNEGTQYPCILAISILAVWLLAIVRWVLFCRNGLHAVFCEHRFMIWPVYQGFKLA